MLVVGAVAVGAYLLFGRKRAGAPGDVTLGMKEPIDVKAGEQVSASTYREIEGKRPGMEYAAVESGAVPGVLVFTPQVNGKFTRNFSREGGQLWAEISV